MAKTFREWDVGQRWLLPPSVQDLVPEGHLAHFVRELVRHDLDLSPILGSYREERGYPPYHPVMMTALLLYAYSQGIYSSRRIARACEQRVDFMAVTALQKPDFRTINTFRKRHLDALGALFGQILRLCQKAGLVTLGHVALDGTKLPANASKHKAMSYGRMKQAEDRLQAEVAAWFEQAEAIDAAEDAEHGHDARGDELPDWVKDKQKRLETLREARAALEAEVQQAAEQKAGAKGEDEDKPSTPEGEPPPAKVPDKAQRNFTDPESRIMKTKDGFVQAYNCQAVVDAPSQVIVARGVTQSSNDKQALEPMVRQIKQNTGRQADELSADAGYCSEDNLTVLARHHIRGYVATGRQKHGTASATHATRAPQGPRTQAMAARLRQGGHRSRYRLRKSTVEPVFGHIKWARNFRQFLLRGFAAVSQEWSLLCTAHNLLKLAAVKV